MPVGLSSPAALLAASTFWLAAPASAAAGILTCTALNSRAVALVGQGHCVDSRNLTVNAYTCTAEPCALMQDPNTCELVCLGTSGCTGFELVNTSATGGLSNNCRVFSSVVPDLGAGLWPWRVENGTQNGQGSGFVVASADGSADACCYKVSYPLPNVNDNPVPTPPLQSEAQQAIFANRSSLAAAAAAEALPALESLIDFCANYSTDGGASHMFDAASCPGMADVTQNGTLKPWPNATEILARFSQELRVAEYGHGYHTLTSHPNISNVFNPSYEFLLNLWEPAMFRVPMNAELRSLARARQTQLSDKEIDQLGVSSEDVIQTQVFGCANFTGPGGRPADFFEANDRIVYTALNYERIPLANTEYFGFFDAVIRPATLWETVLFTPTDSAKYWVQVPDNCTVWPGCTAGTIDHYYHILLSWMALTGQPTYPPQHVGPNCAAQMDMVRKQVCWRPPSRDTPNPPVPKISSSDGTYWEADILGTVRYPEGVKFIVASFEHYFGNVTGTDLRSWCSRHGWVLVWTHVVLGDPRRLVDPVAAPHSTANVTLSPTYVASFASLWAQAEASWSATQTNLQNQSQWQALSNETITAGVGDALLWPVGAMDCADGNNCLGATHSNGDCVCYIGRP